MKILNKIKQFWNKYNLIIKLLLSLCILYFVFVNLNISQVLSLLKEINVLFLIPCLFLAFVTLIFMVLKWNVFLKKYNKTNLKELMSIYWASDFVNLFGIGAIGSETYKMFSFKEKKKVLFSSVIDRIYSLIWYILLGCSIFTIYFLTNNEKIPTILFGILFFFSIVFIYATIEKWIKKKICNLIKNELFNKIIFESQRTKKELIMHSFYCLIIILLQVIIYHLIFSAVGFEVKTIELFILIPLLTIALVLPEKALIASFLLYLIELIYRLFGAIPFLILKKEN